MAMKTYKPTTKSRRNTVTIDYRKVLTASKPLKSLTVGAKKSGGRNNTGRITATHKGGGNKRAYRLVDFIYNKKDIPAKITSVDINEEEKRAKVYLKPDQVSLAIGRGGHNIKLAGKLTGYELDVYRDGEVDVEDVDLEEFADEIESWIIDELKAVGCDSAKSVLELGVEDLVKRTDLEQVTVEEVFRILRAEFDN